jgi:glyoxylase-like metal-dependent hydrolase (beta-lactamase superfamily II)
VVSACARPSPEQQTINDAATAIGGRDRILALKTLVLEGGGTNGNLGQDVTPEAISETFQVTGYKRAIDVAAKRSRTEQTRTPNFAYFQGPGPIRQITGVDGDIGYNIGADGTATRVPQTTAADRRMQIYHHPITILRAALDQSAKLANPHTLGHERVVDVSTADGLKFTLAIDDGTKLPTRVVSMTDNTNLGDLAIETSFADYQDVGGLKLPARLATKTDKYTTADIRVTKQAVDADPGDLSAPQAATSAPATDGPPPAKVTVDEIAKGIWLLAGQTHNSVVVEFKDHVLLIEAPQHDTRALAVIGKARELRPNKPLTAVVNTHHHFDHSGGLRAAVSEGLTVITHKKNEAFYQEAVARPHTIIPDALARNVKPLKIETVDQERTLKDDTMTVVLYPIDGSPHAETLLMAYFPKERLLVEADVFNFGFPIAADQHPFAANRLENIKKRQLKIDRIVPLHGTIAPFKELLKTQTAEAN